MDAGGGNPFAVLTAVVAPAILTNACSVGADGRCVWQKDFLQGLKANWR
jgi:hypothetical protein